MRALNIFLATIILLTGIIFAILNAHHVTLNYYLGQHQFPLSALLVISLGLGLLIGYALTFGSYLRLRAQHYKLKAKYKTLEKRSGTK